MSVVELPGVEPPFPHVLDPMPDESLISFMTRLDRANRWPIGDIAQMLSVHPTSWRTARATEWAAGTRWDLRRLAHLARIPYEAIEALTLLPDLRRATNDPGLTIDALGDAGWIRFCPPCLAETGAIRRFCLLPHMVACPIHKVRLVQGCPRHGREPFPPFIDEAGVIQCGSCERELAPPDGRPLDGAELEHLRDTWRAWTFLLGWKGSDDVRGRGYRTIRRVKRGYPLRNVGQTPSFARLVEVFLMLHIEPELVTQLEDRPVPPCPNASCPRFVSAGDPDPLLRGRLVERHCAECGTRFVGRRILLTFDADHGATAPTAKRVRRAQRRLRRWRIAVADACRDAILADCPVTVVDIFRRSGVPLNANLRAHRLGLTAIVRDAARRQRLVKGLEREPFRGHDDGRVPVHSRCRVPRALARDRTHRRGCLAAGQPGDPGIVDSASRTS